MHALYVELPTAWAMASTLDPSMGEECRKAHLDTAVEENARSMDLQVARILLEVVAAMWEVHRLWEILPTTSRVAGYSKKFVTQKRLSHV
jgi:hypothetical protein